MKFIRIFGLSGRHIYRIELDLRDKIPVKDLFKPSERKDIHKKPSTPYGYVELQRGKAVEKLYKLSEDKEEQERDVMEKFISVYNRDKQIITDVRQLGEEDHDFEIKDCGSSTIVQLTEISLRDVGGERAKAGFFFDERAYQLLVNAIIRKIKKNYKRPEGKQFWLIVWQNDVSIGADPESRRRALNFLMNYDQPFDRIFYFYFYSDKPDGSIRDIWRRGNVVREKWLSLD